ncbi:MAG: DM13 domain-containing protein [Chloroflexi bacterium]|nr:DM13 domain-containing protein [Chloroflexota bacterium]
MWTLRDRVKTPLLVAGVLAGAAVAWYLLSPLFLSQRVDEQFPLTAKADLPVGVSREQAEREMAEAARKDATMAEAMPGSASPPAVVAAGSFRDGDSVHKGEGKATVYRASDGGHLLRFEGFKVTNGPDLHVLLAGSPDPKNHQDLESGGYVDVAKLKGNVGNQNYPLPRELDPSRYRSVVVYCVPFRVVFSAATLARG